MDVSREAADVGFDWPHVTGAIAKVREEIEEVRDAVQSESPEEIREEIGDLLFAVCNVARKCGVSPSEALDEATRKFEARFELVLESVRQSGREPEDLSIGELELHWQAAKLRHD